jgi:acetylornithine deacetylase/succinyl-diaminopimelate desuccinylase-like protein
MGESWVQYRPALYRLGTVFVAMGPGVVRAPPGRPPRPGTLKSRVSRVLARRALGLALTCVILLSGACAKKKPPSQIDADLTRTAEKWAEEFESVRLLRDYVRIDTSIERGEEEGARLLETFFQCAGIEVEVVCPAPRRCNVLARLPGKRREGALLLLNHIDVAPADAGQWKDSAPFEGKIRAGYLYGRGAYDMKSLALAQALAMRSLKERGIVPESDVLFLAEADEEIGQKWGARWLLDNRPEWFRGVGQVLNEGGTLEVILRDPRFWGIETLQAGYASAEFEAPAAEPLKALVERWQKLEAPIVEPHPHVRMGFDLLANHLSYPLSFFLRNLDRVRRNPTELAMLPHRYGSLIEPRIFWYPVTGDPPDAPRVFAALAILATPPGMAPEQWLEPLVQDARKSGAHPTRVFSGGRSDASPYPTAFTELLKRVTEAHFPGVPFGPVPTYGGFTSSVLFRQRGFAAYGFSTIPMNITDSVRRHWTNERLYLRDYLRGLDLYRDVVEEFALTP